MIFSMNRFWSMTLITLRPGWIFSSVKLNFLQHIDIRAGWTQVGVYKIKGAPSRRENHFTVVPAWPLPAHIPAEKYPPLLGWSPYTAQVLRITDVYTPKDDPHYFDEKSVKPWNLEFDDWTMVLHMPSAWQGPPYDMSVTNDAIYIPLPKEMS
jgi:hypothetical protein